MHVHTHSHTLKVGCKEYEAAAHLLHVWLLPWVAFLRDSVKASATCDSKLDPLVHSSLGSLDSVGSMLRAVTDYIVDGRHVYEVRQCLQSLIDEVVQMVQGDDAQTGDILLDCDDLPDLVGENGEVISTTKFHRETHLDRFEMVYKVGSAATGLVAIGQHLDRCPCFRSDKVSELGE